MEDIPALPQTPQVPVKDDKIKTPKQLGQFLSDLTDEEIGRVANIVAAAQQKWATRANSVENLEIMRDEILTQLAEQANVLATLDVTPVFYGDEPIVEIIGKVPGDSFHTEGLDHEKKEWEVKKAAALGEDWRGQKERYDTRKPNR